jgi:hypothetical protein
VATTIGGIEEGVSIFHGLGKVGGTVPSVETLVSTAITSGLNAVVDVAVQAHPTICMHVPNGLLINYGPGYTSKAGNLLTGSIAITYSDVSINGNTILASYAITNASTKNGRSFPITNTSGTLTATQQPSGKVVGDVTVTGAGTNASVSGTAHFDTSQCSKYPISGTVTLIVGSQTTTITFNNTCDGTFGYTSDGLLYYTFEDMNFQNDWFYAMIDDGGRLLLDPGCSSMSYAADEPPSVVSVVGTVSGRPDPNGFNGALTAHFTLREVRGDSYIDVSFTGTGTGLGLPNAFYFQDPATTWALTQHKPDGTVVTLKSGSSWEVLVMRPSSCRFHGWNQ